MSDGSECTIASMTITTCSMAPLEENIGGPLDAPRCGPAQNDIGDRQVRQVAWAFFDGQEVMTEVLCAFVSAETDAESRFE